MELLQLGVTIQTVSPLHHGYTAPAELGDNGHKKTMRLVRQVAVLIPNDQGQWGRRVVPVLGGNAIRGRMRRVAADITFQALGVTPEQFVPNGRRAFHTLTSGGTLAKKDAQSKFWSKHPLYRQARIAEWPILSLFGFSFDDFMERSKLRVHFGWPLLQAIRPAIEIARTDATLFPKSDWIDVKDYEYALAIEGNLYSHKGQQAAHYEYRHADDAIVPMPETAASDTRDNERSGAVLAYQYVPPGVPFGIRMFAEDLTPVEQSLLRMIIETTFPANDLILFGGRNTSGLGAFRVQRKVGLEDMPGSELYLDYLASHREHLVQQLLHDEEFLHDKEALAAVEGSEKKTTKPEKTKTKESGDSEPNAEENSAS